MDFEHFVSLPPEEEQVETIPPSRDQRVSSAIDPSSVPKASSLPSDTIEDAEPLSVVVPPHSLTQKRSASSSGTTAPDSRRTKVSKTTGADKNKTSFHRSKDDYFTLLLPKSVLKMPRAESSEMVQAMATRDDLFQTRDLSVDEIKELRDQRLTQVCERS